MKTVHVQACYEDWRERARECLRAGLPPWDLLWSDAPAGEEELFGTAKAAEAIAPCQASEFLIPRAFLELAERVACHRTPERWALLYRMLWRLSRGGERRLLSAATDPDVIRARRLAKEVGRDVHKMRAFVRFRKTGGNPVSGRERFVAWFEPAHRIVRLNAPFFRDRFAGMDWSILTPRECAHWDGERLHFTPGMPRSAAPDGDALDELWRTYYRSIFNPARLKLGAMRAEMPVKYWRNLPEAPLVAELTASASRRTAGMIDRPPLPPEVGQGNAYLERLARLNAKEAKGGEG